MSSLKLYSDNEFFVLVVTVVTVIFGAQAFSWGFFLFTYSEHQGYSDYVIERPVSLAYTIFYALFWILGFVGDLMLLQFRKVGWIVSQIFVISGSIFLLVIITASLFTPLEYFTVKYILLFILGCVFLITVNKISILNLMSFKRTFVTYRPILIGIVILSIFAAFLFDIFSIQ